LFTRRPKQAKERREPSSPDSALGRRNNAITHLSKDFFDGFVVASLLLPNGAFEDSISDARKGDNDKATQVGKYNYSFERIHCIFFAPIWNCKSKVDHNYLL
jgi:hypothetical protein